jgi:hypothetical protein
MIADPILNAINSTRYVKRKKIEIMLIMNMDKMPLWDFNGSSFMRFFTQFTKHQRPTVKKSPITVPEEKNKISFRARFWRKQRKTRENRTAAKHTFNLFLKVENSRLKPNTSGKIEVYEKANKIQTY